MSGIFQMLLGGVQAIATDAYFYLVTLLLPGNGTNGAQNNTFLDSSTNAFSITRNGNTTQGTFSPFSQTGWSNYFDGSGDYLTVTNNAALQPGTGNFTIEGFYYANTTNSGGSARTLFSLGRYDSGILMRINPHADSLYINNTYYDWNPSTFVANQWNHVALVRTSTTVSVFVNGTRVFTTTNSANIAQSTATNIGAATHALGEPTFDGYISNFRMIKGTGPYDATQTTITVPTAALTAITNTSLLTCQSNRFVDNSSNAFAITVNGDTSVQAFSPFAPTAAYSAGTNGGSGYFDNSGDYLQFGTTSSFNFCHNTTASCTLEAWVYLTAGGIRHIFGQQPAVSEIGVNFYVGSSDKLRFLVANANGSTWIVNASSTTSVQKNCWNHVAVTYDGTTATFYLNGVSDGTGSRTGTASNSNATYAMTCGGSATTDYPGYISSARISNSIVYTTGFTPPTAPFTQSGAVLLNFTNAGIYDATAKNDLETVADAQISNTTAKWGSTSIKFDGTGDYLLRPSTDLLNFGTGDFTVEFWINAAAQTVDYAAVISNSTTSGWGVRVSGTGLNKLQLTNGATVNTSTGVVADSTWKHIAISRAGSSLRMFIDGSLDSTHTNSSSIGFAVNEFRIGRGFTVDGNDGYFNGYIQDLRITKGIARYTANFTAPTAAFPLQ